MTTTDQHPPRTVILTGGTSGLGYFCARDIAAAHAGWHLILTGRSRSQGEAIVDALKRETGSASIEWMGMDLASLASVRGFVSDFAARDLPPLQAILCNAGLSGSAEIAYTEDGLESTFAINCLGHFVLVNGLLDCLAAPGRIVFVSSGTHDPDRKKSLVSRVIGTVPPRYRGARALAWPEKYPDADTQNDSPRIAGLRRYATAKLCVVYYGYELDRRLRAAGRSTPEHPITANVFNPGPTPGTGLARDAGPVASFAWKSVLPRLLFALPDMQSPEAAGGALARMLLDPALEDVSGKYFQMLAEHPSSRESYDQEKAAELWGASAEITGVKVTG